MQRKQLERIVEDFTRLQSLISLLVCIDYHLFVVSHYNACLCIVAKMWTFFLRFVLDWCKQKMPEKTTTTVQLARFDV